MSRLVQGRLKRNLARRQAAFLTLLGLLVILSSVLVFLATAPGNGGAPPSEFEAAVEAVEEAGAGRPETVGTVTVGLGGDVTFALEMAQLVEAYGTSYPWRNLGDLLREYRFVLVNLEGPLCGSMHGVNEEQPFYAMRGDVSCAPSMAEAGVDVVCLGNDHAMDFGSPGLEEALNVLRMAGIDTAGAGSSLKAATEPAVLRDEEGGEVAVLSFSDVGPASYAAGEGRAGVAPAENTVVEEAVRRAAAEYPYVVVFMHWGEIGSSEVTERQRELASVCARGGADLVVGCHPHVVQGMEVVEGIPVFYSLGNLVFYSQSEEGRRSIFLGCRFADGRLERLEVLPILIEAGRPALMSGTAAEDFLRAWSERCPGVDLALREADGRTFLQWTPAP
ncbi:MAG: CapA family protein [Actinobacteria bacterium]|nr:CapA family protein [Actinomycetota bacterium]